MRKFEKIPKSLETPLNTMKLQSSFPLPIIFIFLAAMAWLHAGDRVFYLEAEGNQRFNGVHRLSDGTLLVSGQADSMDWVPAGVPVQQIAATGIDSTAAGAYGFLLHTSGDFSDALRVVHFPQGTVESILHIRSTEVPGEPTGDLYISGHRMGGAEQGYFVARLNNNFVDGVPSALMWARNVAATREYLTIQPWDVRSDGKVIVASGANQVTTLTYLEMLSAETGEPVVVEGWRRHHGVSGNFWEGGPASEYPFHETDPIAFSRLILMAPSHGGLRSVSQEDYDAIEFDGHNSIRKGRYPNDLYFSGPNSGAGRGFTGYRIINPSQGMGQIAIDRRNNHLYFAGNVQTNHAGNQPDFEPHAVAMDANGHMQWWSRLYTSMVVADGINRTTNAFGNWTTSNAGLGNRHVRALAFQPDNANIVYAGAYGGIYKSTDGGHTWNAANNGLTADWVLDIAVAPSQPQTVYAATNRGVFKSTNAGASWSAVNNGITYLYVNTLAVHPANAEIVYAGTARHGVFKTTNGGTSWTASNNGLEGDPDTLWVNAVVIDPIDPEIVYIGSAGGHGISRSIDGGNTWTAANAGLTADGRYVLTLAIHRASAAVDATLYLGCRQGVYRSTNNAATWAPAYGSGATFIGYRADGRRNTGTLGSVRALIIHPDDPDTVFAGHAYCGTFKTTDGGANWAQTNSGLPNLSHTIGNLHNMVFALAMHPADPDTLLLGSLGIPRASIPDQYGDSVAVDYSRPAGETFIAVVGRHHGNDHANLWNGNSISLANNPEHPGTAYHNQFTGTSGDLHLSWIGKFTDADGRLMYATRLAENPDQTNWGARYPNDSILDGWPSRNSGWPNLNTTRTRFRPPVFDDQGRLHVIGVGRRTHTTANAWMKMPNPSRTANITAVSSTSVFRSDTLIGNTEIRPGVSTITLTSAPNNNVERTIADFDIFTGSVTLDTPLANLPQPGNGFRIIEGMSAWNNFVRVFSRDFSTLAYSTIFAGEWDRSNAAGGDNIEILSVIPTGNGVLAVGYHRLDGEGNPRGEWMPTQRVPSWGSVRPLGETPVAARLYFDNPALVRILQPVAQSVFTPLDSIVLQAYAEAPGRVITRVEYFAGGTLLGQSTVAPYTFHWNQAPTGEHWVHARVHTADGAVVESRVVPLTVLPAPAAPVAPANLRVTAVGLDGLSLAWDSTSPDVDHYFVERTQDPAGVWVEAGMSTSPAFGDSGLAAAQTYFYRVRAVNASGSSPASNIVAATTSSSVTPFAKINFQRAQDTVPSGFLADTGAVFGDRGNGFSYGWNANNAGQARNRGGSPPEFVTFNHMQLNGTFTWEIAVPEGDYQVRVVAGDPNHFDSTYRIDVEGLVVVDGTPSSAERWIEGEATVSVTDGRLTVSNAAGAVNNKIAFLEIATVGAPPAPGPDSAPVFLAQPAPVTAALGGTAVFAVSAIGQPMPSFQWFKDGVAIAGATAPSLALPNITAAAVGSYHVVIDNGVGDPVVSESALLSLAPLPVITTQPQPQTVDAGSAATLFVDVDFAGAVLYQWYKDGEPIAGADGSSLTLDPVTLADIASYRVRVSAQSDPDVSALSDAAFLQVDLAPAPVTQWPTVGGLTFGQTLAEASLSGGAADTAGEFVFSQPTLVPNAGTTLHILEFRPEATDQFRTVTQPVAVTVAPAAANVRLADLRQPFDGSPRVPAVVTEPAGLPVSFTFNGSPVAPWQLGTYTVVATIADPNYAGSATAIMEIAPISLRRYLINFTNAMDGTDTRIYGPRTWQRVNLRSTTSGSNVAAREHSLVPLVDTEGDTGPVHFSAAFPFDGNRMGAMATLDEAFFPLANAAGDERFFWFAPSVAEQREVHSYESAGTRHWTFTFGGFAPEEEVTFQFVQRRNLTNRLATLTFDPGGPNQTVLYADVNIAEDGDVIYLNHTVTGSDTYSFRLGPNSGWTSTFNAIGIDVVNTLDIEPTDGYTAWATANNIAGGPNDLTGGVANLIRYALGATGTTPLGDLLPQLQSERTPDGLSLSLTFHRIDDPELRYAVWYSEDLADWGEAPVWEAFGAHEGVPGEFEVVVPTNADRAFLRLEVSR